VAGVHAAAWLCRGLSMLAWEPPVACSSVSCALMLCCTDVVRHCWAFCNCNHSFVSLVLLPEGSWQQAQPSLPGEIC
jgi:hypothetical protein